MNKTKLILFLSSIHLFFSCQSDDSSEAIPNSSPKDFSITVSAIQSSKASLSWTKAIDPDGDEIKYSIELNGSKIAQNITDLSYDLDNLTDATTYEVKITANDLKGGKNVTSKSFSTTNAPIPTDFAITIDNINYATATLSWTESTTTENNTIKYSISLNGESILEESSSRSYELTSLSHNTEYNGQITAKADNGQTLIKDFQFETTENKAPEAFELIYNDSSFSYVMFDFKEAIDPEEDNLNYRIILNDIDVTDSLFELGDHNVNEYINSIIKGLDGSTEYQLKIKAIDSFGNESYSNVVEFTTIATPPNNFEIEVTYIEDNIRVSWNSLTDSSPLISTYILDNIENNLDLATVIKNDETGMIVDFDTDLISPNQNHTLQIVLEWPLDEKTSYSHEIVVNNVVYSETTVEVNSATLYNSTADFFPLQFTISFIDGYISEYEDFEVIEIKFHDQTYVNYVFLSQLEWNKGYLTGNITQEEFDYLSNFNEGYLITKDESGYHQLPFQYTIEN